MLLLHRSCLLRHNDLDVPHSKLHLQRIDARQSDHVAQRSPRGRRIDSSGRGTHARTGQHGRRGLHEGAFWKREDGAQLISFQEIKERIQIIFLIRFSCIIIIMVWVLGQQPLQQKVYRRGRADNRWRILPASMEKPRKRLDKCNTCPIIQHTAFFWWSSAQREREYKYILDWEGIFNKNEETVKYTYNICSTEASFIALEQ